MALRLLQRRDLSRLLFVHAKLPVFAAIRPDEVPPSQAPAFAVLKKIKLIGCLVGGLLFLAVVREDALVLFVGELQDVDLATKRQCIFHPFAQRINLRLTGAKAHVHRKLRHRKTGVEQAVPEVGRSRALNQAAGTCPGGAPSAPAGPAKSNSAHPRAHR